MLAIFLYVYFPDRGRVHTLLSLYIYMSTPLLSAGGGGVECGPYRAAGNRRPTNERRGYVDLTTATGSFCRRRCQYRPTSDACQA